MAIEWTHKSVAISDIRKVRKFYILSVNNVVNPIFVDQNIFEGRINSYYLRDDGAATRSEILDVAWNMVITEGYFYKIDREGPPIRIDKDPNKSYISFLEIEGPLGNHVPNYNKIKNEQTNRSTRGNITSN